jgi:hypothetical protein
VIKEKNLQNRQRHLDPRSPDDAVILSAFNYNSDIKFNIARGLTGAVMGGATVKWIRAL